MMDKMSMHILVAQFGRYGKIDDYTDRGSGRLVT
jgi:hypothetical protein